MSRFLLAAAVLSIALGACAPTSSGSVDGMEDLMASLRASGASVEDIGPADQEFFSAAGRRLLVDGHEVQVFEYPDEAARQAESDLIQPDGAPNPTTMVMWIDQPNFFAGGRLIALYLGRETSTRDRLTAALGDPLTDPGPTE